MPPKRLVQVALVVGGLMDAWVGLLALLLPRFLGPLLDIPAVDPTWTAFAGAEFLVVAVVYFLILRDMERFRPFMLVVAFDQFLAAFGPLIMIWHGQLPNTWKTAGPLPVNFALWLILAFAGSQKRL
jgi:hypothetical protein